MSDKEANQLEAAPTEGEQGVSPNASVESGEEEQSEKPHFVHELPPPTLWEKITGWRGSFLVLSILFHVILIAIAAILVVQVVKGREKLKFTAPPPTQANKSQEHKVQMAKKKTSMSAPSISKRITSTAVNTSIALPAVQMSSSSSPDLMSSVMSGMGGSGLGAGFGSSGGGGALGGGKLTAFGFKGTGGLIGNLYDLKQDTLGKPTGITLNSREKSWEIMNDFFSDWDAKRVFEDKKYFKAPNSLTSTQWLIPDMDANKAPEAFEVAGKVQPTLWFVHYKGKLVAPFTGRFRFIGRGDNLIAVRFNGKNVLVNALGGKQFDRSFPGMQFWPGDKHRNTTMSDWITITVGETCDMEVALSEWGGKFEAVLFVEEEHPKAPYPQGTLPVFQARRDLDFMPYGSDRWKVPVPAPKNTLIFVAK